MNLTFEGSKNYVASEELMRSVNIAIALQKPLLIKGEPGYRQNHACRSNFAGSWQKAYHLEYQIHHKGAGWSLCV